MSDYIFTNVLVFDGSGEALFPADVRICGNRIAAITLPGCGGEGVEVIDGNGGTLMPGLIESHAHFDFGSSLGKIPDNPFKLSPSERMLCAVYAARTLLDYGYTSAYSAGCFKDVRAEVALRKEIEQGRIPGPRMKACSSQWMPALASPDSAPFGIIDRAERSPDPASARAHVLEMAEAGVDVIKFGLNGESGLIHGTTCTPMFYEEEFEVAMQAVRDVGLEASAHAYTDEAVRMALRHGVRTLYHCAFMKASTLKWLGEKRNDVFIAPGPGILWATVYEAEAFGLTLDEIEKMEAAVTLERTRSVIPQLRALGVRVLPGGDYGFPWNPIGRNARDLSLFVSEYGYTAAEALHAATALGGQLMGMENELGMIRVGYLADLLLIDGNPLQDLAILQSPERLRVIVKDGVFHKNQVISTVLV